MNSVEHLLPEEFRSGNNIPVERATISRERMLEIVSSILHSRGIEEPYGYVYETQNGDTLFIKHGENQMISNSWKEIPVYK